MASSNVYASLGVDTIINAAGTFTDLGGSLMAPEVVEAWAAAAEHFVDYGQLQDRVGQKIAGMLGLDAALVTGGAASSILLGTAAAITLKNADFPQRNVMAADGQPYEVLRQRKHRDLYDRQVTSCGVVIVDVDTEEDVRRLASDRTVLMLSYNLYEPAGKIKHREWLELARSLKIPTLLDAAADTPPLDALSSYTRLGYDLVAFSGGKAIRGPQGTGLLLGRGDLVDAAKLNAVPNEGTIGRVAKVSKEDVVAFHKALEIFLREADQIAVRCQTQIDAMLSYITKVEDIQTQIIVPPVANHFPHLLMEWDEDKLGYSAAQVARALRSGTPPIATGRVYGTGTKGLLISPINLQPGEDAVVGRRIMETVCALRDSL